MRRVSAVHACGLGLTLGAVVLAGCAGDQPKSQPSTEAIQKDSDRFFEKLRQEEQERGSGPAQRP